MDHSDKNICTMFCNILQYYTGSYPTMRFKERSYEKYQPSLILCSNFYTCCLHTSLQRYYPLNVIFVDMIFSRRLNQPTRIQPDTLLLRINFIYIGSSIVDIIIKSYEMIERSKILIIASHKIIRSVVVISVVSFHSLIYYDMQFFHQVGQVSWQYVTNDELNNWKLFRKL